VVGTHALMQEGVAFRDLALVIIDEQHRFGVHQRLALREKGRDGERVPHQLVLTATPIPRTLAMTAYADLDVSVIDELPPGRTPVGTVALANTRRAEVIDRIRAACAEGRQAYWVCTLIEESEALQAQAAEVTFEELRAALPDLRVGLVHGRMKPAQKQAAMQGFKDGAIALLVATTVIEVGVDVPNASLMVIENAERLGLAQLHQLRGRVGRGSAKSSCVLLYQPPLSQAARQRLDVMRETNDGFRIAEKDLELRGPGEVLGTRQTGQLALRIADLARDAALLPAVQRAGAVLLRDYPDRVEPLIARWVGAAARYAGA
jgi:ATP-dependent DNA helicase RecG